MDRDRYVEEALGKKVAQGHTLTKLQEMDDMPRVVGASGYSLGAVHILEAEMKKWCGQ